MQLLEALQAGLVSTVGDIRVHAVKASLTGPQAVCGAGTIIRTLPQRFADDDPHTCYACLVTTMPQPRLSLD